MQQPAVSQRRRRRACQPRARLKFKTERSTFYARARALAPRATSAGPVELPRRNGRKGNRERRCAARMRYYLESGECLDKVEKLYNGGIKPEAFHTPPTDRFDIAIDRTIDPQFLRISGKSFQKLSPRWTPTTWRGGSRAVPYLSRPCV